MLLVNLRLRVSELGIYFLEFLLVAFGLVSGGRQPRIAQWFSARRRLASHSREHLAMSGELMKQFAVGF